MVFIKKNASKSRKRFISVPGTGLEPASLWALAPETSVSTNFTIRAKEMQI